MKQKTAATNQVGSASVGRRDETKREPSAQEQAVHAMRSAKEEILWRRDRDRIQTARLQMFDDCMLLLKAQQPSVHMGMSECPVQKLERAIDNFEGKKGGGH